MRTAVGPGLLGTGVAGEVVAEGFASVTHLGPDSGRIWDCAEHTVLSRAPWRWASAAAPDGAHPAVLGWGSAPSPPGCARDGALSARRWAGGEEGRQVGRRLSRSLRVGVRRRVRGTSGFRAPPTASPTAQPQVDAAGVGSGILGGSSTEPRPSGGGSLAERLEMRLSNPAEASGNGIFGAKGGRNYKVTPSSPGRRNAKGL